MEKENEMEKTNVSTMDDEALAQARQELGARIEALPARFTLYGNEFTWQKRRVSDVVWGEDGYSQAVNVVTLRLFAVDGYRDLSLDITEDGAVKRYSFPSSGGDTNADAEKTVRYYRTCCALLSEEFRGLILRDYREKLAGLTELESAYDALYNERSRRREEAGNKRRAEEAKASGARRRRLEAVGQVWYDYHCGASTRYVVKSVSEKTVTFRIWFYHDTVGWKPASGEDTKRLSRRLLGVKPGRMWRNGARVSVCPVGTNDLDSQQPEVPETVGY
jgi:hypothetical protein